MGSSGAKAQGALHFFGTTEVVPSQTSVFSAYYKLWDDKGAIFLTEPLDNHGWESRCYMRDPDGYLIEVGQYTQASIDRFKNYAR